ncbi:MAG: hypothetical protein UR28_C0020G0019 [Candidatus Peregrinibacteria bacterium GW2011_GWF2_33_10]|nr:MAG: hypothetical protein UR28_C0020G0019 [Candidatus Peregrinibacteria bacterium GW2011_GWF2_33_10]OGJ45322.1 MAG: hypothetical protein A2272_06225 [Candidatus Peregrinibacteria bacterium RIFOXYA12_FULL_33_12]OGJ45386.1 MAG: hypothetical protein A2263_03915 [Candidatus Peregrinibacteria bacterium RIFOXYA2_FULL_33_21]OGJ50989.1 MAG: hypothetical protein A2307_05510 [Candidatus Peregrinibacteria bacterium RIFOXYB2_FULL_33_20]
MADQSANPIQDGVAGTQQPNIKVEEAKDMFDKYINAVSANITTNEVTLQLGVTKAGSGGQNPVTVSIVGNLYMTHQTAYSMIGLLQNALKTYQDKVSQMQNQQQAGQAIPNEGKQA